MNNSHRLAVIQRNYSYKGKTMKIGENAVERSLILNKKGQVAFPDLQAAEGDIQQEVTASDRLDSMKLDTVISNHIRKALEMTGGKVHGTSGAARLLHVNPSTLRKRMKKLNIAFGRKWKKSR